MVSEDSPREMHARVGATRSAAMLVSVTPVARRPGYASGRDAAPEPAGVARRGYRLATTASGTVLAR